MSHKILVVDDEKEIVRVLKGYLESSGFTVLTAYDGPEALAVFRHDKPDLIILDLMLPGEDGLDVTRIIRRESNVPIIMLTARVEEVDKLIGLELGADDYITKPFSPREVVARVRVVLRRVVGSETTVQLLKVGDLIMDEAKRMVGIGERAVDLTPTEFELLLILAKHPGRVFSRLQLLDKIQGYAYEGYERTIDAHVKNIRQKIEPDPKNPRYVLTVYGLGYKFAEPGADHA